MPTLNFKYDIGDMVFRKRKIEGTNIAIYEKSIINKLVYTGNELQYETVSFDTFADGLRKKNTGGTINEDDLLDENKKFRIKILEIELSYIYTLEKGKMKIYRRNENLTFEALDVSAQNNKFIHKIIQIVNDSINDEFTAKATILNNKIWKGIRHYCEGMTLKEIEQLVLEHPEYFLHQKKVDQPIAS